MRAEDVDLLGSHNLISAVLEVEGALVACPRRLAFAQATLAEDILTYFAGEWPAGWAPNAGPLGR